jgi:hypothetical protein
MNITSRTVRCVSTAHLERQSLDGAPPHLLRPLCGRPMSIIGMGCALILASALAGAARSLHPAPRSRRGGFLLAGPFTASRGRVAFAA